MVVVRTASTTLLRFFLVASASVVGACSQGSDPTATHSSQPSTATSARPVVVGGVDDPASLAALLRDQTGEPSPTAVVARTVDGGEVHSRITLAYLTDPDFCGSGGCTLLVAAAEPEGWVLLGRVTVTRPPIRVLTTRTNGMPDLAVKVCGGGILECYEAVLPFDGNQYASNPTAAPARKLETATDGEVVISEDLVRLTLAREE